jgi:hypothetical protein
MEDSISFIDNNDINNKIEVIMRQTNYTYMEARTKLILNNYDHIKVIKIFLGVKEKKEECIKSINQEIYKQIRYKMDASMKEYNKKQENITVDL